MSFRLHRPAYQTTFSVHNTGRVYGGEVCKLLVLLYLPSDLSDPHNLPKIPQLYLNFPPSSVEPPSVLRGFSNVELQPGEKQTVTITLSRYDLSIWDVEKQGWRKPDGEVGVTVGASSRDGRLKGTIPM
jgi:beta-glucosidase